MTFPVVEASRLCLFRGDVRLIDDASLKVYEGQWCEIIGPPLSGKTTIIQTLIGNHHQGTGQLNVLGFNLFPINREDARLLRRKVGYAQQLPDLLMDKTIRVNLLMALQAIDKAKEKTDEQHIIEILDEVGLIGKMKTEIRSLAYSELIIVSLLRCLIHKPRLILIDQLLDYLDKRQRNHLIAFIYNLVSKDKLSVITTAYSELTDLPFETSKLKIEEAKLFAMN